MVSVALEAWCRSWMPRSPLSVTEWARRHVKTPHSSRATSFDPDQSYWLTQPLNRLPDNNIPEIGIIGPPGSSKTTYFEAGIPYIISEEPGPTQLSFHTDTDAEDWLLTRGKPVLRGCRPVKDLWPEDKNKDKKDQIIFDHMPFWIGGANFSSLQSKSVRWVFGDEVWRWKPGMMREARARTHDRWNAKCVFTSQGGDEKTELHQAWMASTRHIAHFSCPHCSKVQKWNLNQLLYDETKDENGIWNYDAAAKSARYVCVNEECKHAFQDDIQIRRQLAATLQYIPENPSARVEYYQYNFMTVWWISWGKVVIEWIQANEAKHRGDWQPLIKFKQKRMAEFWTEEITVAHKKLIGGSYSKADYVEGQLWDGELYRFFAVDKQQDHFWAAIRAIKQDGSSRLIFESRVNTEEALRDIQLRYKVQDQLCFMDARYRTTDVYRHCAKFGWTAFFGDQEDGFNHYPRGSKKPVRRYFSPIKTADIGNGCLVRYILFSNEKIKDLLSILRGGHGPSWEVPSDISEAYVFQIDSEVKRDFVNKTTKEVSMRWVRFRDNHLFDCEVMLTAAANMFRLIGGYEAPPPDEGSSGEGVDKRDE